MKNKYGVGIAATGMVLPKHCYTNNDIIDKIYSSIDDRASIPELTSEWIEENIWIKTRYYFDDSELLVDVSVTALEQALKNAGWDSNELDFIIFNSISTHAETNSMVIPSVACSIQNKIGAFRAFAYDSKAACSGWVYGMAQGAAFIESGMAKKGAIICSEKQSAGLNYSDHRTSILIGDVATVTLIEQTDKIKMGAVHLQANTEKGLENIITLPHYRYSDTNQKDLGYFALQGKTVFKQGINTMVELTEKSLRDNKLNKTDVDWFIYHQANGAMLRMVGRKIGILDEKNLMNINKLGNTTSGTIPSVLHMYIENGTIKRGDKICFVSFGGGLTAGSLLFTY